MNEHLIEIGDKVNLSGVPEGMLWLENAVVLGAPRWAGDTWKLKNKDGSIHYVQQFESIALASKALTSREVDEAHEDNNIKDAGEREQSRAQSVCSHPEYGVWSFDHLDPETKEAYYLRRCCACGSPDWRVEPDHERPFFEVTKELDQILEDTNKQVREGES